MKMTSTPKEMSLDEAWWGVLSDLDTRHDELKICDAVRVLTQAVRTPLPEIIRPAIVRDVCSFLVAPSEKSLIDRIKFLTLQEVKLNEMSQALRLLPVLAVVPADDLVKACRHVRTDLVEAAMSFFQSEVVKNETLEDKITFLQRNKELSSVEIDEALDRLSIPRLVRPIKAEDPSASMDAKKKKALIDRARAFLASDAVAQATESEVVDFLVKIGLHEDEIKQLRSEQVAPAPQTRQELLNRAKVFLMSPAVKSVSEEEVNQFLLKEGLTLEDIVQVRQSVATSTSAGQPSVETPATASPEAPAPTNVAATEPLSTEKEQRIQRAIQFLRSVPRQGGKAEEFLRSKGYTQEEIDLAIKRSPATVEDDSMIDNAARFLVSTQAQTASDEAIDTFLLRKGLSKNQIDEARIRANRPRKAGQVGNSNVDRAVEFLLNPSTQGTPLPDRVAFLKSKGLSEAEIRQALEKTSSSGGGGVSMNSTNAMTTKRKLPGFPTMCISTAERLAKLTTIQSDELVLARASFLSVLLVHSESVLRLPQRFARIWTSDLLKYLREAESRLFTDENEPEEGSKSSLQLETLVADACEVIGAGKSPLEVLNWLENICYRVFGISTAQGKIGSGLMLSRCFHGHFCARASVTKYELIEPVYAALTNASSMDQQMKQVIHSFLLAAAVRGALDFGCGLNAPRVPMDEKNERNVAPEKDMRASLNGTADQAERQNGTSVAVGAACVYAGLTWLDAQKSWQCIADSILKGSLGFEVSPSDSLDSAASKAVYFVNRSAFKLAATSAQVLCTQCAEVQTVREEVLRQLNEHADDVYRHARASRAIRSIFAKRMVERTYDDVKSQMTLEDAFGASQGQLGRIYQTQFLVLVVLLEPCLTPDKSLEDIAWTWECVASLGFALVPVPEVLKLNQWMDVAMRVGGNTAFKLLAKSCRVASTKEGDDDWVLAAKLEYLMDTGKRIVKPGWDEASLIPVEVSQDDEAELLAHALVFGASFPFSALNRRCHSMITENLAASCVTVANDESSSSSQHPLIVMAMIPEYVEEAVKTFPRATPASSLAFVMGSVLTSLGQNSHPLAQPIAVVAYSKLILAAHEALTAQKEEGAEEAFSREIKTRADLVLNLAFASLKACSLPALAPCLDRLELLFKFVSYRELHGGECAVSSERMRKTLFGVVSRIDDSNRRAILALWFLKRVQDASAETTTAEGLTFAQGKLEAKL